MLNYRHLHYFWVDTKSGGVDRVAERLDTAVQTISAQVRELDKALGHQRLKPCGRGVALAEAIFSWARTSPTKFAVSITSGDAGGGRGTPLEADSTDADQAARRRWASLVALGSSPSRSFQWRRAVSTTQVSPSAR